MSTITEIDTNRSMDRTVDNKVEELFFLKHILSDAVSGIVDFGCKDGRLFQEMRKVGCDWKQIGIDHEAFKELFTLCNPNAVWITSQYPALRNVTEPKDCVLNLSNMIHEVYSQLAPQMIDIFWKAVFHSGFQYIVIQDMITTEDENAAVSLFDMVKLNTNDTYREQIEGYESVYGNIKTNRNLYHFLLKHCNHENWNRDLHTNYLPLTDKELMSMIPDGYEVVYEHLYTDDGIRNQVFKDFDIRLKKPTHIKLILKRTDSHTERMD